MAPALAMTLALGLPVAAVAGNADEAQPPAVTMFSSDYCPPCLHAKQYFREHEIEARVFDIDESAAARKYFEKLGGRGLPLIFVDNRRLDGYSPERFERLYRSVQ